MKLLTIKEQKETTGGAAWIIGALVLISFFDIVKISLDSYQIAQHSQQPNQNEITKRIEEAGTRSLRQKWDILYV
ncbi:hypothetical protein S100390_v1c04740 [Spiroplasma sp. NBRC 100390]|uniref:hypothetical protein n=1 Tax=unclassified Spiroplasma TaxID=2637901 RepID=UPI000892A420|nr:MULTISPECIES: hypothetical protein [unclassified Spiroplasma]AOX43817.1 hypothetical protein STU14_v1c04740 [Spiroplasma sp. TU-14]APE13287.1 hypothetical protein S100390_v1c04740 [Spiroplasma sp. NBRC 100390]